MWHWQSVIILTGFFIIRSTMMSRVHIVLHKLWIIIKNCKGTIRLSGVGREPRCLPWIVFFFSKNLYEFIQTLNLILLHQILLLLLILKDFIFSSIVSTNLRIGIVSNFYECNFNILYNILRGKKYIKSSSKIIEKSQTC